ncbi:MAG: hypothetical protein JRH10_00145 [Deltaproteobacteria bacterium]|nr:hypothetical protein [Deltaproteobacteria bacterium]
MNHERARNQFPSVLLGVLGIIQALAMELLWEHGVGGIGSWRAIDAGLSGWLQVSAIFMGIVLIWIQYAILVLRFSWVPRFFDLAFPFVLGALEFLLIASCGPETIARYFVVLAVIFMVSAGGNNSVFQALFSAGDATAPPRRQQLMSYLPMMIAVVILLACAVLSDSTGAASRVTLVCLVAANAGVIVQLSVFRLNWNSEMGSAP